MSAFDKKEEMIRLFKEGKQIQEIASLVGVSRPTVRKYLQAEKLTKTVEELWFGDDVERDICWMYKIVQDASQVAKHFEASAQGVRKVLLRHGVELRKVPERELNTEPFRNLVLDIPEEVNEFLNKIPRRVNPRTAKAESLFKQIGTEEKAYWLGFIYADGGVHISHNPKLYFGVKELDKDILLKFCRFIGINDDSVKPVNRTVKGKKYTSQCLEVPGIALCQILIDKGVFPKKSLTQPPPTNDIVPEDLVFHFIRGYFDGDGGINSDGSISVTGTLDMIEWIVKRFGDSAERKLSQKDLTKNTFTYRVGGEMAKEILDKLYLGCSVALDRKLSAYKSLCGFSQ